MNDHYHPSTLRVRYQARSFAQIADQMMLHLGAPFGLRPDGTTNLPSMRMLHLGLRVTDLQRSLAFYSALGYAKIGHVPQTEFGSLTMLQLPDDPFVSLELVHDPARPVEDIRAVNHLVVQVDDLNATIADLATKGLTAEPPSELGPGMQTSWLTDPDGYRIELVQWPPDHPAGMTATDFA